MVGNRTVGPSAPGLSTVSRRTVGQSICAWICRLVDCRSGRTDKYRVELASIIYTRTVDPSPSTQATSSAK
jgi:hypothetical protein